MEWYRGDSVLKNQSQQIMFPLQDRWKHWNDTHSLHRLENGGVSDEAGFSCVSSIDNVEMDRLIFQRNQAEIPCFQVQGVSDESSLYWSRLLNNQDYQPYGLSGTNLTDENFMNSLLVDDVRANEHFLLYNARRPYGSFSLGNSYRNDMLMDSSSELYNTHHLSSYEDLNGEEFHHSLDWYKNQSEAPSYMMTNSIIPPKQQQTCCSRRVGDQLSVEETVLQELGSATQKMTEESRLCFRDALYRLASNSEKYSRNRAKNGDRLVSDMPLATASPDQTLRSREREARTNTIDRAVAELMFNKAYLNDKRRHQELVSSDKACTTDTLRKLLAPHFQHFAGHTPEDAVVPTMGQGEQQYEY